MRLLGLLIMCTSGCLMLDGGDGYGDPPDTLLHLTVDRGWYELDKVEVFSGNQWRPSTTGWATPELPKRGALLPLADLYAPHYSWGYVNDPPEKVEYEIGIYLPIVSGPRQADEIYVAVGYRGTDAAVAGMLRMTTTDATEPEVTHTLDLAPVDVEVWSSHACVRYSDGASYVYLVERDGC